MQLITVYTTVATQDDAQRMARAIVGRKLAACAQLCEVESFYSWQGEAKNEPEWRVALKTTADGYAAVESAIRELHSYELPDIHAVAIEQVSAAYGAWVEAGSCGE
jgi:periplasmic divalent cation tolerance protein